MTDSNIVSASEPGSQLELNLRKLCDLLLIYLLMLKKKKKNKKKLQEKNDKKKQIEHRLLILQYK